MIKPMQSSIPYVRIYTDGACDPNPGPGGWAALLQSGEHEKILTGSQQDTTNNRMELTAALRALEALKRPSRVEIYTDSEYLRRGITEWLPGWRRRNWRRKGGELKNVDLWQALDAILALTRSPGTGYAGTPDTERTRWWIAWQELRSRRQGEVRRELAWISD
jgi:ribonuclease HI